MAESLFDNRYRYDYIYPRGRSGETLRAVDVANQNRPVVIKRPAPGDAPPIRAGQEVSILNERRALQRLAGHPVLTTLLDEGRFNAGGTPHQYIVMERAEGLIVGDLVLELAEQGEHFPHLEMLTIVDALLDLLENAHENDIVYNDVDAKHLFWNRDEYALKVIDWGNAVFLEGDTMTPGGISRQTDVYQAGELLYFILSGGRRADVPRTADENFRVQFEENIEIDEQLRAIISRALHPDTRLRYASISALRDDLAAYRRPLERDRDALLEQVNEQLQQVQLTRYDLRDLQERLQPALSTDPAYPPGRATYDEIVNQQLDLNVEADLDAVQIYIQGANPARALDLLQELRDKSGPATAGTVRLLIDSCQLLLDSAIQPVPQDIMQALDMIFAGQASAAAGLLLEAQPQPQPNSMHWQIAERISAHIPNVLLLRPNLFRLEMALRQLHAEGYDTQKFLTVLQTIAALPQGKQQEVLDLSMLRDSYRNIAENLTDLNRELQRFSLQHELSNQRLPLSSLERAMTAAQQLTDSIHVISKQAASRPRDAFQALDISRNIDPTASVWGDIEELLEALYGLLEACQSYIPVADGTDLADWLRTTRESLLPFQQRLSDTMIAEIVTDVEATETAWITYREAVLNGDKGAAVVALEAACDSIQTLSPTMMSWFNQLRTVVNGAQYIERHSVPGAVGAAIADGWQTFDRGNLAEAEQYGQQTLDNATEDYEQLAGSRLRHLAQLTRLYIERGGIYDVERSRETLEELRELLTAEERHILDDFTDQMPNSEVYLRVMSKGLVEVYQRRSTAARRILFMMYIIMSGIDIREGHMDDGLVWREAALKTLDDAQHHPAFTALDTYISRHNSLQEAQAVFDKLDNKAALADLEDILRDLENNDQSRLLESGISSIRDVDAAINDWSDGEFRDAGLKLESALKGITETENAAELDLEETRDWLMTMMQGAAELHVRFREMRAVIDARPDDPDPIVKETHHELVEQTELLIGFDYAARLRQWRDTYNNFFEVYTSEERRSKRLEQLNALFRAMFIDKHPAYPLYRHWYSVLEGSSEFPAPVTDDVEPRIESSIEEEFEGSRYLEGAAPPASAGLSRNAIIGGVIALALLAGVFLLLTSLNGGDGTPGDATDIPATVASGAGVIPDETDEAPVETEDVNEAGSGLATNTTQPDSDSATTDEADFATPTPVVEDTATATLTEAPVTPTEGPSPTASDTPTITPTPTDTPTVTRTPLPEGGVQGRQDILDLFAQAASLPYSRDIFSLQGDSWRLGTGVDTPGDILYISPPEDLLEEFYGNDPTTRIARIEASIELTSKNASVIGPDDIFFGLMIQSAEDGNNVGIRVKEVDENVIQIDALNNNETIFISQRSLSSVDVRLRIDRDSQTGDVTVYFNNVQQGDSFDFLDPDAPVLPVLFVKDGGVIVRVKDWFVTMR